MKQQASSQKYVDFAGYILQKSDLSRGNLLLIARDCERVAASTQSMGQLKDQLNVWCAW